MKSKLSIRRSKGSKGNKVERFLLLLAKDKKTNYSPKYKRKTSAALFNNRPSDNNSDKNSAQK